VKQWNIKIENVKYERKKVRARQGARWLVFSQSHCHTGFPRLLISLHFLKILPIAPHKIFSHLWICFLLFIFNFISDSFFDKTYLFVWYNLSSNIFGFWLFANIVAYEKKIGSISILYVLVTQVNYTWCSRGKQVHTFVTGKIPGNLTQNAGISITGKSLGKLFNNGIFREVYW